MARLSFEGGSFGVILFSSEQSIIELLYSEEKSMTPNEPDIVDQISPTSVVFDDFF